MATKRSANWSQGNQDKREPAKIVYTRKNTPYLEWIEMLKEELTKVDIAFNDLPRYAALHAWELDDTPSNFAFTMLSRRRKEAARSSMTSPSK